MSEKSVKFPSGPLALEGALSVPEGPGPFPLVVVCHPHPIYGGSMGNNVVLALSDALAEGGILALRFNFRGVGGSQGSFAQSVGEREDVRAALSYGASLPEADAARLGLAGYSFGATVAVAVAAADDRVKALAAISMPLPRDNPLRGWSLPKLFISGERDRFTPAEDFQRFVAGLTPPVESWIHPTDHFWWSCEAELANRVTKFFQRSLGK